LVLKTKDEMRLLTIVEKNTKSQWLGDDMCVLRSEIGTKAAWKGFSSQTTYIAYRLMILKDDYEFYPERIEDLMIKNEDKIIELIQIKNLSSDLTLSSFTPKEEDSFFRRALKQKLNNENIILKIVSFGKIGEELKKCIFDKDEAHIIGVKNKLKEYNYETADIEWLLTNLTIESANEKDLENKILKVLEQRIETMAAPRVAFDTLICYISHLSRFSQCTSREKWEKKLNEFIKDINSINGICSQYGRTIINLSDYKTLQSINEMTLEYNMGINAHPQHIRYNLDIIREEWLDKIQASFSENNRIVIVKGASGQGKSSLAYRYLIDNYVESYVFVIERVTDFHQALDIVSAVNGLAISRMGNVIVYIDVYPNDKEWLWIVEEVSKRGINLKILITIREEDFNRSDIDLNKIKPRIIELIFSEYEAKQIFIKLKSTNFLNFDQAWERFGGEGPFMEFIYLLSQSDTLENRLRSQINKIINTEKKSDEWLNVLQVICYAGQNNLKINLMKLSISLNCNQTRRMINNFKNEYLIRFSEDNQYVECLHSVRAKIIYKILKETTFLTEENILLYAISSLDEFCQSMIVQFFFDNDIGEKYIIELSKRCLHSWSCYSGVLSSLIWLDSYRFYKKNYEIISKGNKLISGSFLMFAGDLTGYLNFNHEDLISFFENIKINDVKGIKRIMESLHNAKIDFFYTDILIENTKVHINTKEIIISDDLSEIGFCLFWMAQRNAFLNDFDFRIITNNLINFPIDQLLDFLVGIQLQNKWNIHEEITEYLLPIIIDKYKVIRFECKPNFIEADFINDLFEVSESSNKDRLVMNDKVMRIVDALRRMYFFKERYIVKAVGLDIIPNLEIYDSSKNIHSDNLPLVWITQLNGWVNRIDSFEKRLDNWVDIAEMILYARNCILNYLKMLSDAIVQLYKTGGNFKRYLSEEFRILQEKIISLPAFQTPKCINDKCGLVISRNKVNLNKAINNNQNDIDDDICSSVNDYIFSIKNVIRNVDFLYVSKCKREENEESKEQGELATINSAMAVMNLLKMQRNIKSISDQNNIFNDNIGNEEYEELLMLIALSIFLNENKIRKDSSVLYNCKRKIKDTRNRIDDFFTMVFDLFNVKARKLNNTIYIDLNVELVDQFSEQLFLKFNKEFYNITTLSLESVLIEEFAEKLIICLKFNEVTICGHEIKISNLINCDNIDKFLLLRIPIDLCDPQNLNPNILEQDSFIFLSFRILGEISSLSLFYNYTTSVMSYIKIGKDDPKLQVNAFNNWFDTVKHEHCNFLDGIIHKFKKIETKVPAEMNDVFHSILNILNNYKESNDILAISDREEFDKVLNSLNSSIVQLLDTCCDWKN
jgi:hypothetical protein